MRIPSVPTLLVILLTWATVAWAAPEKIGAGVSEQVKQGRVRVLVVIHDASDKSAAMGDRISALKAQRSAVLEKLDPSDYQLRREFSLLPAFAIEVDAQALTELVADPRVRRIDLDSGGTGHMLEARPLAHIDSLSDAGLTGAGQTIAVIDTGISANHFDFRGRVVAEQCFCSSDSGGAGCCPNGAATQSGTGSAFDDNGHGTNVSGIAAGGGAVAIAGVAPAANIVAVKVIDANNRFCCFSDVLAAFDWVRVQHPEAKVVNASLGTSLLLPGDCDQATSVAMAGASAIELLAQNGALVFASAGNQGNADAMSIPACLSGVVGVGATWDRNYESATALGCTDVNAQAAAPTCFSNSSAGTDLYAPGAFITSSGRSGGQSTYAGTSQASPLSAGCAALLRSVVPDASAAQVRAALQASPTRVTDAKNGRSFPLLDCSDALARLDVDADVNRSAIYYAPANAGYGVAITHQDQILVAIWYSYDANGRPTWYTAAASRRDDGRYRGDYFFSTGRPLATIANAPASLTTTAQGVIEIDFDAEGQLDFAFTPNAGASQHRLLQPLPLAASPLRCTFTSGSRAGASNYSDLWWNPNENGWGLSIQHQGNLLFIAWYTYANDQQPQWLTSVLQRQADGSFTGRLNRPASGTPYTTEPNGNVTAFPVPEVGDVTLSFSNGETGTLGYSVDGVTQSKVIQRLVFGTQVQVCE